MMKVSYFPICEWTNRKSVLKVIAISSGQLLVLKGEAAFTMQLAQTTFGGKKSQQNWMRWQVLGLNSTVCRTMAANSKSHHNHINEINQWISSSQMSGWQGGIQPSLVINFCGGRESESNVLSLMVLYVCVCFKEFYLFHSLFTIPSSFLIT